MIKAQQPALRFSSEMCVMGRLGERKGGGRTDFRGIKTAIACLSNLSLNWLKNYVANPKPFLYAHLGRIPNSVTFLNITLMWF